MIEACIIQGLGGSAAVARAIGAPLSTVDSWKQKGRIPHWRLPALRAAAVTSGKPEVAEAIDQLISGASEAA